MRATTFSEFLRFYRRRAALTQEDLAGARQAAVRAVQALGNGYGPESPWTRSARLLVDSLTR